jgi:hypothetical protein
MGMLLGIGLFVSMPVSAQSNLFETKLIASDAADYDFFGYSVSVSGDTALVGARWDDDVGEKSGSAYVFVRSGFTWTEQAKLTASDGGADDRFGWSVSVDGDTALIGAWSDNDAGTDSGSAYVFVRTIRSATPSPSVGIPPWSGPFTTMTRVPNRDQPMYLYEMSLLGSGHSRPS